MNTIIDGFDKGYMDLYLYKFKNYLSSVPRYLLNKNLGNYKYDEYDRYHKLYQEYLEDNMTILNFPIDDSMVIVNDMKSNSQYTLERYDSNGDSYLILNPITDDDLIQAIKNRRGTND